jgi:hypothetical protein
MVETFYKMMCAKGCWIGRYGWKLQMNINNIHMNHPKVGIPMLGEK